MSSALDSMYNSLLINRVPLLWENAAYPSLRPLASWLRDFKERIYHHYYRVFILT